MRKRFTALAAIALAGALAVPAAAFADDKVSAFGKGGGKGGGKGHHGKGGGHGKGHGRHGDGHGCGHGRYPYWGGYDGRWGFGCNFDYPCGGLPGFRDGRGYPAPDGATKPAPDNAAAAPAPNAPAPAPSEPAPAPGDTAPAP